MTKVFASLIDNISKDDFAFLLQTMINIAILLLPLIVCVAYLTLAERKIIGRMQLRKGPSITGPFGLLQPIADALKLIFKEIVIPDKADKLLFFLAPAITLVTALAGWAVIPVTSTFSISNINVAVLYLLAVSSLGVYGVIIAGWSSNSKYAFLGAIRSSAQMISYEIIMGLCVICVILITGSLNLKEIVDYKMNWIYTIMMIPVSIIFFISILAETNRHPFDLPEAESELVAGYHVEYSSTLFAMFFLGEYANMIIMSAMAVLLFFGGWHPIFNIPESIIALPEIAWFAIKVSISLFIFIWVRAALPRYRYDQLMSLGWKRLLPMMMFMVIAIAAVVFCTENIHSPYYKTPQDIKTEMQCRSHAQI